MKVICKDFENEGVIPSTFCCDGENINPELTWEGVPEGTKSFALSIKDPDAPVGTFVHWLIYDIPGDARKIDEDSAPGKQVVNDFGKEDYGGPCPPSGIHRYYFTLHALDVETLGEIASKDEFDKKVEEHSLDKAEIMGKYSRD